MILDEPYEGIIKAFNQEKNKIDELSEAILFMIGNTAYPSFFSKSVPDVPNAIFIAFLKIKDRYGFIIRYNNGNSYLKEFSKEEIVEYVFTPCLLDLVTLTPINKQ